MRTSAASILLLLISAVLGSPAIAKERSTTLAACEGAPNEKSASPAIKRAYKSDRKSVPASPAYQFAMKQYGTPLRCEWSGEVFPEGVSTTNKYVFPGGHQLIRQVNEVNNLLMTLGVDGLSETEVVPLLKAIVAAEPFQPSLVDWKKQERTPGKEKGNVTVTFGYVDDHYIASYELRQGKVVAVEIVRNGA